MHSIPHGKGYISKEKYWWVANKNRDLLLEVFEQYQPVITLEFGKWAGIKPTVILPKEPVDIESSETSEMSYAETPTPESNGEIAGLHGELMDFQKEGVAYAVDKGCVLIADEMGLGKTIQALAFIQRMHNALKWNHGRRVKVLVVCPASLKINWEREANLWCPELTTTYISSTDESFPITDIIIINYDLLSERKKKGTKSYEKSKYEVMLSKLDFDIIILDESHYIKNKKAKRSKATLRMRQGIFHRLLLTGTPILSRPEELINQLEFLDVLEKFAPEGRDPEWYFKEHFCNGHQVFFGNRSFYDSKGASNLPELNELLKEHCMIRRRKSDVLKQLPPKRRQTVYMALSNRKMYEKVEADLAEWVRNKYKTKPKFREQIQVEALLNETSPEEALSNAIERSKAAEHLVMIEALKQTAVEGKLTSVIAWVQDFIEIEKLVLFGVHTDAIDRIVKYFGKRAVKVIGEMNPEERQEAIDKFQTDDEVRLFVGNMTAAGIGITLTAASNVAFFELGWTPGSHVQAEDRVHRIGQESNSVNIYYLVGSDTIEEYIAEVLEQKAENVGLAIDGIQDKSTEANLAANILKIVRRKHK